MKPAAGTARLGQIPDRVHSAGSQSHQDISSADQRQYLLLRYRAVCDRPEGLQIETRIAGELLGINLVALLVAVRDRPQFAHVGHDHFMAKFLDLFGDPDRVGPCFHGYPYRFQVPKPLVYAGRVGSETTPVGNFTSFVECAVMAPGVPRSIPIVVPALELLRGISAMRCCVCFFMRIVSLFSDRPSHLTFR
jgi:hypothetical protein